MKKDTCMRLRSFEVRILGKEIVEPSPSASQFCKKSSIVYSITKGKEVSLLVGRIHKNNVAQVLQVVSNILLNLS